MSKCIQSIIFSPKELQIISLDVHSLSMSPLEFFFLLDFLKVETVFISYLSISSIQPSF